MPLRHVLAQDGGGHVILVGLHASGVNGELAAGVRGQGPGQPS